jgi:flagellar hook-associated protein 1 FlgK
MSISSLLFTARDSLISHQMAIDVTGANIANVDTPGYSQQRAEFKSIGSINIQADSAQVGVDIERIARIYDSYVEAQLVTQQQNNGYSETMLQGLKNIEVIVDDTNGGGLSEALNKFWAAWEDLSQNPGGEVQRNALYSVSENLINTISYYQQNLVDLNGEFNDSIKAAVPLINDKISEITDLNLRLISAGEDLGENNDLLDQRNEALKGLSELININSFDNTDGTINVYLSNGQPLLQGYVGHNLSIQYNNEGQIEIHSPDVTDEALNNAITKGKLGATIELQKDIVPEYLDYLDKFASTLATQVNELHAEGYDAYQNTGTDFFEISDPDNAAATIKISAAITADKNRIAASTSVTGDGENASRIAAIQKELVMDGNTSTLNGYVSFIVSRIGHQVSTAKTYDDHQTLIMTHLTNQRDAVSGVSIDEEMLKLVKYQMGYTAAAKLCNTVNELLDELMGIVS